ncbi:MAG: CBS domain-containing protein [Candidatus Promineifilaceae bacterium]|nr:CBS domain-containing protein [Candidatus Promineifilaceae bacterium]
MTHEKSDFDAIASQLAAHKLFPNGIPLLSRHLNRNVQQFLNLYWDILPFMRPEEWRRKRVDEVVLVDTQNLNSVRGIVKKPRVRVIDHHVMQKRRDEWLYTVEAVGATTTLLVEMLQQGGLYLSSEEATLLLLGIYEDTGSLTYDTVTPRDARAGAWLLDQGAQLSVVRRFLAIPLTREQQELYNSLQANAEWLRIQGRTITLAKAVAPPGFTDEISSIAHRLRETLSPEGLFVLVQLGKDVQLVARSSHENVDVAAVARELGGGGHSRAAAALIVNNVTDTVAQQIKSLLPQIVKPMARVSEIMSLGVQTVDPEMSIDEAGQMMQRSGHEGYPVVAPSNSRIKGLLTRHAVDRAQNHKLGHLPVKRFMKAGSFTVQPSDSIEKVQELMLSEGWGQIPVVSDEAGRAGADIYPIGIVTRTDLLNYWFKPVIDSAESDMRALLAESLSPPLWSLVLAVSESADKLKMPLYFVGGLVRDLLLNVPAIDLDMVVEGDAIELVRLLKSEYGGDVHTHARFGTAKWFIDPNIWQTLIRKYDAPKSGEEAQEKTVFSLESVDFVTARSEFYKEPSALPDVESGSIKLDLHRRDFTINTLAVRLDGAHLGELLDFYGGRRDLERGMIRVLHSLSFIDDPTRILRAVRLEQRLGFQIEPRTLELLADSLPMLSRVTGSRIRHEIELGLSESDPERVMRRLSELNVMGHIQKGLTWTDESEFYYGRVNRFLSDPVWQEAITESTREFLLFTLWVNPLPVEVQKRTVKRLRGRKTTRDDVLAVSELVDMLSSLPVNPRPSQVARICRMFRDRVLLAARVVLDDTLGKQLDRYYSELRFVKTTLSGDDLQAMGLKPGPQYARYLGGLLDSKLDGLVHDEEEERRLLAKIVAEVGEEQIDC